MNHSTHWASSDVGGLCWVSDPAQAYIEAKVTSVSGGHVIAKSNDGREFDVDLELPLKPPSRKQKEARFPASFRPRSGSRYARMTVVSRTRFPA